MEGMQEDCKLKILWESLRCTWYYEPQVGFGLMTKQKFRKEASFKNSCDVTKAEAKLAANWFDGISHFPISKGSL